MPFLSVTQYVPKTPEIFINATADTVIAHNKVNSLFNKISTIYQSGNTSAHLNRAAAAESSCFVPLSAACFNLPEHLRAAYGTSVPYGNNNTEENPSNHGEKSYIHIGQDGYRVHFDANNAVWRIFSEDNPAKPALPVIYCDGRWQLHNDVGLPGGHPANLPEPLRALYSTVLPQMNAEEKKATVVHYQGKYYIRIGEDYYWLKHTQEGRWLICSQTDEAAKPVPVVHRNNQWQLALRATNTDEMFSDFSGYKHFRQWFHSAVNVLSLLGARHQIDSKELAISALQKQALLKFVLQYFQMQATYSSEDIVRLDRQTSPLVTDCTYSRANVTRLWLIVHDLKEEQLEKAFKEVQEQALQSPVPLAEEFNIFPASRPFPYRNGLMPEIAAKVPLDLNQKQILYIASLGVQLFKASSRQLKFSEKKGIDSFIALRGLRMSPNECAEILAREMVCLIEVGQIDSVRKMLTDFFYYRKYSALADGLRKIELAPNGLIASVDVDPLSETGIQASEALYYLYHQCCNFDKSSLAFYVRQNIAVLYTLMGPDPAVFFTKSPPAFITAEFSDGLQTAHYLMIQIKNEHQVTPVTQDALRMEQFYQVMQRLHHLIRFQLSWNGTQVSLDSTIRQLLPADIRESACVIIGPHGLSVFDQLYKALPADMQRNAAFLQGVYFETPALLPGAEKIATVYALSLRVKALIATELHPNNAGLSSIVPHCPITLIRNVFAGPILMEHTIVMDVTANHLNENEIRDMLAVAKPWIDSGHLNLILLQSGTKLFQFGMDIVSIGVGVILNNRRGIWSAFNDTVNNTRQCVSDDDRTYIASMLAPENMPFLQDYLTRIRENTRILRAQLEAVMVLGHNNHNALELCNNTDPGTVYIALKPTDRFIALQLGIRNLSLISYADRLIMSEMLYEKYFLATFKELASVERQSFGFNITAFSLCDEGIRVTMGIEERYLIEEYARRIMALSYTLYRQGFIPDYFSS